MSDCILFDRKARSGSALQYGAINFRGRRWKAHRLSYHLYIGEIPEGQHVLHKCDTPLCINPDHLYLGTHQQNMADREARGRQYNTAKTHCKRGHPLSGDNLIVRRNVTKGTMQRVCVACRRERDRQRRRYE